MKSWPAVKLGRYRINSKIAQNHSPSLLGFISGHCVYQFHETLTKNKVKLQLFQTLLKIIHLASWKKCSNQFLSSWEVISDTWSLHGCAPIHVRVDQKGTLPNFVYLCGIKHIAGIILIIWWSIAYQHGHQIHVHVGHPNQWQAECEIVHSPYAERINTSSIHLSISLFIITWITIHQTTDRPPCFPNFL